MYTLTQGEIVQQSDMSRNLHDLDLLLGAAVAALQLASVAVLVRDLLDGDELVDVLRLLSTLELVVSRAFAQTVRSAFQHGGSEAGCDSLSQALLELGFPLALLELLSPLPLLIESFLAAPLLPCDLLDLHAEEQHHVGVRRRMRVRLQQVRKKVCVSQLGVGEEVVLSSAQ